MNAAARSLLFVVLFSMVGLVIPAESAMAQDDLLIYDGETAATYTYGSASATEAFRGAYCFEGVPDAWHPPGINLAGLPSYRKDISACDEIWLYAKTNQPTKGVTFDLSFYANGVRSNEVNIAPYIEGGRLDGTYRLIRVPIAVLKSATCPMTSIGIVYFGVAKPTAGHKIYIDEVSAVALGSVDPNRAPFIAGRESVSFGDVGVRTSLTKSATLTNVGTAPLVVSAITITGSQSGDFTTTTAPFTVEAGQSQQVDVVYTPSVMGAASATLVLTHTPTVLGDTTSIALSGNGLGPLLTLSATSMDLGSAPLGHTVSWPLPISNMGNQDLVISNASAARPFSASPAALTVPPNGAAELLVSFSPAAASTVTGQLAFTSNDPNQPQISISLKAKGVEAKTGAALLTVRAFQVTSSTVRLAWPQFSGADKFSVYLAPEPEGTRNEPLYKVQVSEFPGTATGGVVEKLAADVDAFFRVDALEGTAVLATGSVHVRTLGGPYATLDTPVREVHLMGPKILQVVLENKRVESYTTDTGALIGYTGPEWQSGDWTVTRADGSQIVVTAKYRHSVPVGQNYYEVGYATPTYDKLLDVDHRIFLVLDSPVGYREILHVQGPFSTDFLLPYSDHYLETPVVQLNQVGYSPRATERWAYVSGWLGDGGTLSLADFPATASVVHDYEDETLVRNAAVSSIQIALRSTNDEGVGGEVREIDLSGVPPVEGAVYRVCLPGVGVSWPTQVSETAVFKTFFTVARGLYHNRWGRDLKEQWTEWAPRNPDHPTVYTAEESNWALKFAETTPKTGERPMVGGHHDAADFDIRIMHTLVPMYVMRAYEANPGAFTDGQLMIPESGNGIPDLLDEAIWNLKGWVCLQEADGAVRTGVESWRHPWGIYYADEDPLPYWTYARDAVHTARVAGLLAQAAWLMKPFADLNNESDPVTQLYHSFYERAISAYTYATSNGVSETIQGPMFLAAGELYRLTGDAAYKTKFEATWAANHVAWDVNGLSIYPYFPWATSWLDTTKQVSLGDHLMGYLTSSNPVSGYLAFAHTKFAEQADTAVSVIHTASAHRNGRPSGQSVSWGQATAIGRWLNPVYHASQLGGLSEEKQQAYFNAMSLSADYILGGNPNGTAWITGLGSRHPENPCHNDSLAFIKAGKGPVPGIPVYGPTTTVPGVTHYRNMTNTFYPAFTDQPPLRRYSDTWSFITNNEFTVTECQAPDTELFAMLLKLGMMPPPSWKPFQPEHDNPLAPRESAVPTDGSPDTTPPNPGQLTAPAYSKTAPLTISYTGVYDTQSGLKNVKLWVKMGTTGAWQNTGQTSTAASGTFQFQPTGDNRYYFFLQAEDNAGNVSPEPTDGTVLGNP